MSNVKENGGEPVRLIPVDKIKVLNPRARNKEKYAKIVDNIGRVGLKKPITVRHVKNNGHGDCYELICGQGRLEAFIRLGQTEVPAIVIDASHEDCLVMSLVENIARRAPQTMESVRQIGALREQGYTPAQIAKKVDLDAEYVRGLLRLHDHGEVRLLDAVARGQIPVYIAMEIAKADDDGVQRALAEAYEKKQIKGDALIKARRICEARRLYGKGARGVPIKRDKETTSASIVRAYQRETQRQQLMVKKARLCEARLLFVTSAFRQLLRDQNFINVLRAEGLETLPRYLAERIKS
jgi:ParB family transcriptional regulator, chromosome partitioning protein